MKQTSWIKQSKRTLLMGTALAMGLISPANAAIDSVQEVQTWLTQLGFEPGPADGSYGKRTQQALEAYYQSKGGSFDGELSENEVQDLKAAINVAGLSKGTKGNNARAAIQAANFSLQIKDQSVQSTIEIPDYSSDATVNQGINVFDVNNDGFNEVFLCATTYINFVDNPAIILEVDGENATDSTTKFFGTNIPTSNQCTHIYFTDLNADGLNDVVYADAGRDAPPWTGTAIEVALNNGSGFTRVTERFQKETFGIRAYSVAAGNFDDDKYGEILLSAAMITSEDDVKKSRIIQFDGNEISVSKNPFVGRGIWLDASVATNIQVTDIDADGINDIYVGGTFDTPSNKIFWSGISAKRFSIIKDAPIGHINYNKIYDKMKNGNLDNLEVEGADIPSTAIADFDNDGDLDIINAYEQIKANCTFNDQGNLGCGYNGNLDGDSFLQVLMQTSKRKFNDVTQDFDSTLGNRYFLDPLIFDINEDGLTDIILNYWNKGGDWTYGNPYGSTILMNKGEMKFQKIESKDIQDFNIPFRGLIFPIKSSVSETKILVLQPLSGRQGEIQRRMISYTATLTVKP